MRLNSLMTSQDNKEIRLDSFYNGYFLPRKALHGVKLLGVGERMLTCTKL